MFEKLSRVEERYNKIAADLGDPAGVAGGSMWKNTRYSGNRAIS